MYNLNYIYIILGSMQPLYVGKMLFTNIVDNAVYVRSDTYRVFYFL